MNAFNKGVIYSLICLSCFSLVGCGFSFSRKLTVNVVDENGQAVCDAEVRVLFPQGLDVQSTSIERKGKTGKDGVFIGSARIVDPEITFFVEKDGYYRSSGNYYFNMTKERQVYEETGKRPVSEVQVVLKKINHPAPMYVRWVEKKYPDFDRPAGFDLIKGDWVKPYGTGETADINFLASVKKADREDWNSISQTRLVISFSNPGDGIREVLSSANEYSDYKFPVKMAPEEGYQKSWLMNYARTDDILIDETGFSDNQNFVFRVRTVTDAQGKVTKALYGKIPARLEFLGGLRFIYYLNPDGTRNLEFNPEENLVDYTIEKSPYSTHFGS